MPIKLTKKSNKKDTQISIDRKCKKKKFIFCQSDHKIVAENKLGGKLTELTKKQVEGFTNMSLQTLELYTHKNMRGYLKPIWHDAQKLGYCTAGHFNIQIHSSGGKTEQFTIKKGEIFYIPQGSVHFIQLVGDEPGTIVFTLNNPQPTTMSLLNSLEETPNRSLLAIFQPRNPQLLVKDLNKSKQDYKKKTSKTKLRELIGICNDTDNIQFNAASAYKFNIEESKKNFNNPGGYLLVGLKKNLPILNNVGCFGFGLTPRGAVEPHIHTNSDEIVYVSKGRLRATVCTLNGDLENEEFGEGGGFYARCGAFHSFENASDEESKGMAFFDNPEMLYLGLGEMVGSLPKDIRECTFGTLFNKNVKLVTQPMVITYVPKKLK